MTVAATPDEAPEVSVRVTSPLLHLFSQQKGAARTNEVLQSLQLTVPIEYLTNPVNFISLSCLERIAEALARESGDPHFARKAGAMTISPEALGFVYYMFRAFGTPRNCYEKTIALSPAYNRVGFFQVDRLEDDALELTYKSTVRERTRIICECRQAQFGAIPTIWGLPPAEVIETRCQSTGADSCHYSLRWKEPASGRLRVWGSVAGIAAGAGALALGVGSPAVIAASLALLGGTTGLWLSTRADLRRKEQYLASTNEGLMTSFMELQVRYEELHKAKLELEARVDERTRELSTANDRLAEALSQQREVDRLKTEFFDNVSHELRTPLTLILLALDALATKGLALPPEAGDYLKTIERSSARLLRMINNLLDLAKLEAGRMRLRYERIQPYEFIKSAIAPFEAIARDRRIRLSLSGGHAEDVHADAEQLDVIFQNLISNALKFTDEGGAVTVTVADDADAVRIAITDTGVGMGEADLPLIFNRFAQADAKGKRRFGGSGIGLSLVKEIVELHGGTIGVESAPGRGSTFTVRLPKGTAHIKEELRERRSMELPVNVERRAGSAVDVAAQAAPVPMATVEARNAVGSRAARSDGTAATSARDGRPTVLVIEDDPDMRRFIRESLSSRFQVVEAGDGEEGLERCRTHPPDVVVSDVMMPRLSGLDLVRALRASPTTADLPAILVTSRRQAEAAEEGLGAGATDYIGKPFSPRELLARVETQLRLRAAALRMAESEKLATLGLVTAGFAHEVRNPLNGLLNLLGPVRQTLDAGKNGQALELLAVVEECGLRVKHLAESLLAFSRRGEGEGAIDIGESLGRAVDILAPQIPAQVRVSRSLPKGMIARADANALNQVWVNLLDNALRAVGSSGELELAVREDGPWIVTTIRDSGPGIPDAVKARIFEPFFSTRAPGEGTGLGLALCRRIVADHNGEISAGDAQSGGTVFTVRLPKPVDASLSAEVAAAAGPDARPGASLRG